jgi:uncharacterized iron-regulated protein
MFLPLLLLGIIPQAPAGAPQQPAAPAASIVMSDYVPQRVYDTRRKAFTDFETMLADLVRADVVMVGEQHDDANTHRLEHAILLGLLRREVPVTVSMEMFERDTQTALDAYLAGKMSEEEFLKTSRPWPRYATDYRPLVETAKVHGWPVIAANVPRRLAADVSKSGKGALDSLGVQDRAYAARDLQCPLDDYYTRFAEQMGGHPGGASQPGADDKAMVERYYWSQCLKDETMAESIAAAFQKQSGRPGTIVHYTGSFHSDYGTGTSERVRRRLPGRRVAILSMVPIEDIDHIDIDDDDIKTADYLVFTVK